METTLDLKPDLSVESKLEEKVTVYLTPNILAILNYTNPDGDALDKRDIILDGPTIKGGKIHCTIQDAYDIIDVCSKARENNTTAKLEFNNYTVIFK